MIMDVKPYVYPDKLDEADKELASALSSTTDWDEVEHADLSQIDYSKYKPYQSLKTQKIIEKWL